MSTRNFVEIEFSPKVEIVVGPKFVEGEDYEMVQSEPFRLKLYSQTTIGKEDYHKLQIMSETEYFVITLYFEGGHWRCECHFDSRDKGYNRAVNKDQRHDFGSSFFRVLDMHPKPETDLALDLVLRMKTWIENEDPSIVVKTHKEFPVELVVNINLEQAKNLLSSKSKFRPWYDRYYVEYATKGLPNGSFIPELLHEEMEMRDALLGIRELKDVAKSLVVQGTKYDERELLFGQARKEGMPLGMLWDDRAHLNVAALHRVGFYSEHTKIINAETENCVVYRSKVKGKAYYFVITLTTFEKKSWWQMVAWQNGHVYQSSTTVFAPQNFDGKSFSDYMESPPKRTPTYYPALQALYKVLRQEGVL